jgi:hypothetical protein
MPPPSSASLPPHRCRAMHRVTPAELVSPSRAVLHRHRPSMPRRLICALCSRATSSSSLSSPPRPPVTRASPCPDGTSSSDFALAKLESYSTLTLPVLNRWIANKRPRSNHTGTRTVFVYSVSTVLCTVFLSTVFRYSARGAVFGLQC